MNKVNDGGPAFPIPLTDDQEQEWNRSMGGVSANGMSLRDYFAAKAMQGDFAAQNEHCGTFVPDACDALFDRSARMYYRMADAMLAARDAHERPHP